MKLILTFIKRGATGRKTETKVEATLNDGTSINELKTLWEAEQLINSRSDVRLHVDISEVS
jgi:hypothetical protein